MTSEIEQEYNNLSKKYSLPAFKEIDKEFEISSLEDTSFLLRNTLRKISEKLEFYTNMLNDLLQPDTSSLSSMHEISFFTEEEKNDIYQIFKQLMRLNRNITELILEADEDKTAQFLNSFFTEWLEIKKVLISCTNKMKKSWEKETTMEQELGYFG
ncbi:MAG TPA: hypothetical protein QGI22_01220 [Candidatus Woesearchaeota archaeon]|jgi:hypothetical protein|nr:hypothetical protein [Candidatus Woesearchaeota archaeon]HJN56565.1 hypothetical protein [Candidatus Woesearchaeota archaeon]|tara:strand:+ start:68 stop:535 length:468 start_codon:yes stop_codon:yes gene_type:complete